MASTEIFNINFSPGERSVPQIRLVSKILFSAELSIKTVKTRIGSGAVDSTPCQQANKLRCLQTTLVHGKPHFHFSHLTWIKRPKAISFFPSQCDSLRACDQHVNYGVIIMFSLVVSCTWHCSEVRNRLVACWKHFHMLVYTEIVFLERGKNDIVLRLKMRKHEFKRQIPFTGIGLSWINVPKISFTCPMAYVNWKHYIEKFQSLSDSFSDVWWGKHFMTWSHCIAIRFSGSLRCLHEWNQARSYSPHWHMSSRPVQTLGRGLFTGHTKRSSYAATYVHSTPCHEAQAK